MPFKLAISVNKFRHAGGMESHMLDLIRTFVHDGNEVSVYASGFDTHLPEYQQIRAETINLKQIPKPLRVLFFSRLLQKQQRAGEIMITLNHTDHADLLICGGNHLGYLRAMQQRPKLSDRLQIKRGRSAYHSARAIIAHSALLKRELIELYNVEAAKIHVLYPPTDTGRFAWQDDAAATRQRLGFNPEDTVFLFPSTGHIRKGLPLLAEAFAQSKLPVKLAVAGSPVGYRSNNLIELGFCRNMPELYRAADYTIMASLYEPFGLVGIESLLCHTRVVMSQNMACTEVFTPEAGFLFDRNQPASLQQALADAVALKQAGRHKLTDPQQAFAGYNPSIEQHVQQLYSLIQP